MKVSFRAASCALGFLAASMGLRAAESEPQILTQTPIPLPAALANRGITTAQVRLSLMVDGAGRVTDCLATEASDPALCVPAEAAVRQWRLDPGSLRPSDLADTLEIEVSVGAPGSPSDLPAVDWAYRVPGIDEIDGTPAPLKTARPTFPAQASGLISIAFFIDQMGRVRLAHVVESISPALDDLAVAAVRGWRFAPPLLRGQPTIVRCTQSFYFGRMKAYENLKLKPPLRIAEYDLPGPRFGAPVVTDGKAIYVIGGHGAPPQDWLWPNILRFDLVTHDVTILGNNRLISRVFSGAALVDGRIYIIGGRGTITNTWQNVQIYDIATDTFTDGPRLPNPRANFAYGVIGRRIYVAGGTRPEGSGSTENEYLDLDRNRWVPAPPLPIPAVVRGTVPWNGTLFIAGGEYREYGGLHRRNSRFIVRQVEVFDPAANRWRLRRPLVAAIRTAGIVSVGPNDHPREYIFGNYRDVEVYDLRSGISSAFTLPLGAGFFTSPLAVGNTIYLIGGTLAPGLGLTSSKIEVYEALP